MENHINTAATIAEAVRLIYGYDNGTTRRKFKKLVKDNSYDISHLKCRVSKYETIVKKCPVCNTEFETRKNHRSEKTTCSHSCSNTYFRSGVDNPNWKDDRYRTTCFAYHKKQCVICGEDKIVDVHHYDENKKNNNPSNLIPLCPTHHMYLHSRYKDEIIKIVDAYVTEFRDNFQK